MGTGCAAGCVLPPDLAFSKRIQIAESGLMETVGMGKATLTEHTFKKANCSRENKLFHSIVIKCSSSLLPSFLVLFAI